MGLLLALGPDLFSLAGVFNRDDVAVFALLDDAFFVQALAEQSIALFLLDKRVILHDLLFHFIESGQFPRDFLLFSLLIRLFLFDLRLRPSPFGRRLQQVTTDSLINCK